MKRNRLARSECGCGFCIEFDTRTCHKRYHLHSKANLVHFFQAWQTHSVKQTQLKGGCHDRASTHSHLHTFLLAFLKGSPQKSEIDAFWSGISNIAGKKQSCCLSLHNYFLVPASSPPSCLSISLSVSLRF